MHEFLHFGKLRRVELAALLGDREHIPPGREVMQGHAEVAEVRQLLREPGEIADAIVIAVEEAAYVRFVDDRVLVPVGICHRRIKKM